jgi:hypothetical protein
MDLPGFELTSSTPNSAHGSPGSEHGTSDGELELAVSDENVSGGLEPVLERRRHMRRYRP